MLGVLAPSRESQHSEKNCPMSRTVSPSDEWAGSVGKERRVTVKHLQIYRAHHDLHFPLTKISPPYCANNVKVRELGLERKTLKNRL